MGPSPPCVTCSAEKALSGMTCPTGEPAVRNEIRCEVPVCHILYAALVLLRDVSEVTTMESMFNAASRFSADISANIPKIDAPKNKKAIISIPATNVAIPAWILTPCFFISIKTGKVPGMSMTVNKTKKTDKTDLINIALGFS